MQRAASSSSLSSDGLSDSSSSAASSSVGSNAIKDLMYEEPMFHVLGQFLVAGSKNVADVLAELVAEVAKLRAAVQALRPSS